MAWDVNSQVSTINVTATLSGAGALGALIAEAVPGTAFLDIDATAADGLLIPLVIDRTIFTPTAIKILTAELIPLAPSKAVAPKFRDFRITLASATDVLCGEEFSVGTLGTAPATGDHTGAAYVGRIQVLQIVSSTELIVRAMTAGLTTGDLVGQYIHENHAFGARAQLGLLSIQTGNVVSGATVRVALVQAGNPSSGGDYATRLAADEIIWSTTIPLGVVQAIDFGGWAAALSGNIPFAETENRLILAFYWESGTPAAFDATIQLTYIQDTGLLHNR